MSLDDLLQKQINEIYAAEHQLLKFLGKLTQKVQTPDLESALQTYQETTQDQITRFEQVFNLSYTTPVKEKNQTMKGLISEGKELLNSAGNLEIVDAAVVAILRQVVHFQIAALGIISTYANLLEHSEYDYLIQECLEQEINFQYELIKLLEKKIDYQAGISDHI